LTIEATGSACPDRSGQVDLGGDGGRDPADHFFLDLEEAVQVGLVFFHPQQHALGGIHQVNAQADHSLAFSPAQMRDECSSRRHSSPGRSHSATSSPMTFDSRRQLVLLPLMRKASGSTITPFM